MICLSMPSLFSAVVLVLTSLLFLMTLGPGEKNVVDPWSSKLSFMFLIFCEQPEAP